MRCRLLVPLLTLIAPVVAAQTADEILADVRAAHAERVAGIADYTVVQKAFGQPTILFYEKMEAEGQPVFRMVPPGELQRRATEASGGQHVELSEDMARAYEMTGDALEEEMRREGVPTRSIPFLDPRNMLDPMADFIRAGAEYQANEDDNREATADQVREMGSFAERAQFIGEETVDGRRAYLLRADDLSDIDIDQPDGADFTLQSASLWIDAEKHVVLKLLMEGEGTSGDETTPLKIERRNEDFREVDGMYESFRQVMSISGLAEGLSGEERQEMEKARRELAKVKEQLEQLPESQRDMIMSRMGAQMEQLERMAGGDGPSVFEAVTEIIHLMPNSGVLTQQEMAQLLVDAY